MTNGCAILATLLIMVDEDVLVENSLTWADITRPMVTEYVGLTARYT